MYFTCVARVGTCLNIPTSIFRVYIRIIRPGLLAVDCSGIVITADGIQPLVSNVLGKQMATNTGGGEAQYMQQQSQIYVFSTLLANKGADSVMRGDYPSIIDFHRAQPTTKKFLEVLSAMLTLCPDINTVSLLHRMSGLLRNLHF